MTTARDIILEIKRQYVNLSMPVPDEVDLLAYINRVLSAFWNYALRVKSEKLTKEENFISDSGNIVIDEGISECVSVRDNISNRYLRKVSLEEMEGLKPTQDERVYIVSDYKISVYPLDAPTNVDVAYIPMFTKITDRSQPLPFTPALDNSIIYFVTAMLTNGASPDVLLSDLRAGNPVSQYFRGKVSGQGPW